MRAEIDALQHRMTKEICLAQQKVPELQRELQRLKTHLSTQPILNSELTMELGKEKEKNTALQEPSHQDTQT